MNKLQQLSYARASTQTPKRSRTATVFVCIMCAFGISLVLRGLIIILANQNHTGMQHDTNIYNAVIDILLGTVLNVPSILLTIGFWKERKKR